MQLDAVLFDKDGTLFSFGETWNDWAINLIAELAAGDLTLARRIAEAVARGEMAPGDITPDTVADHLQTADIPDPDLVIRTSGDKRLSNFLIWQAAYAELVFVDTLWPDFTDDTLGDALAEYASRERRFGAREPWTPQR